MNQQMSKISSAKQIKSYTNHVLYCRGNLSAVPLCLLQGPKQQPDLNTVQLLICESHQAFHFVSIKFKWLL
jgi:hypothetical protein